MTFTLMDICETYGEAIEVLEVPVGQNQMTQ